MAHEYATLLELKATLSLGSESFADTDLQLALTAASRSIDNMCGRRFWEDNDATSVRYYTPDDPCVLRIDDLVTVTSVETDPGGDGTFEESWVPGTDFVLEPLNAAVDGRPWTEVRALPNGGYRWPCGLPRSVKVTGQFGWAAVPETVKSATMVLAAKLTRRAREAPFGVVALGLDGGAVRIARTDPDVMFLVGDYIRGRVAVA